MNGKKLICCSFFVLLILLDNSQAVETSGGLLLQRLNGVCKNCDLPYTLDRLQFLDANNGWASGVYMPSDGQGTGMSTILRTADGGRTWKQLKFVKQIGAEEGPSFYFINSKQGWISWLDSSDAENHLIYTKDSGKNWKNIRTLRIGKVRQMLFFGDKLGYAVGSKSFDGSYFASTKDGGLSWSQRELKLAGVHDMIFIDSRNGWLLGRSSILRTSNYGNAWHQIQMPSRQSAYDYIRELNWTDAERGWLILWHAGNEGSHFFQTVDGGLTWHMHQDKSFQGKDKYLYTTNYISDNIGVAFYEDKAANQNYILVTKDGGNIWQQFRILERITYCQRIQNRLLCAAGGRNLIEIKWDGS